MNPRVVFFLSYLGPQLEKERESENEKRKNFWCRSPERLSKARIIIIIIIKSKPEQTQLEEPKNPNSYVACPRLKERKWKSLSHVRLLWPQGLYSPWSSPGQNTGVGSLSLLQGIFPTQGSNPGLPHCGQILYQLSHKRSPLYSS